MTLLTYESVKEKEKTLQAMTSLTGSEFDLLAGHFARAWEVHQQAEHYEPAKGGRKPRLRSTEERLFFILFYLKTYPLQEVMAHLFGLSQGTTNQWLHRLSEVLKNALAQADQLPARLPQEMLDRLAEEGDQALALDATERRINRPSDDESQKTYYSGKKKPIP
jgi:transposase